MGYEIVLIISLVLMFVFSRQDYERKNLVLLKLISKLRTENDLLIQRVMNLEALLGGQRNTGPSTTQTESDIWKRAWAREFLRIRSDTITTDALRSARREAIKREHPDSGGTAERMRMIEEAVETLSR